MSYNRKTFFAGVREIFGSLNQQQVDGLEFLLGKLEADDFSVPESAYILATVDHETAHTFQPIKEFRARGAGRKNQDRYWLSGFYGRGYVQLTWKKNYEKFGIADDPDKALEPETAYRILKEGMQEGLFTGHRLSHYINDEDTDYVNARRVINGLDKAKLIASNAKKFEAILKTAVEVTPVEVPETPQVPEEPKQPITEPPVVAIPTTETVKREEVSKKSLITTVGTVITGAVTSVGLGIKTIYDGVGMTLKGNPYLIIWVLIAFAMVLVGLYYYDKSKERALERQRLLIEKAASLTQNTVKLL